MISKLSFLVPDDVQLLRSFDCSQKFFVKEKYSNMNIDDGAAFVLFWVSHMGSRASYVSWELGQLKVRRKTHLFLTCIQLTAEETVHSQTLRSGPIKCWPEGLIWGLRTLLLKRASMNWATGYISLLKISSGQLNI